ncbi:MAG: hypothetical protein K1Y36_30710 [Blastocatellia bacterium]|nr:hypothetical protein [Blastocatellia bacterium]
MGQPTVLDSPVWEQFQKAARARRRNPVQLLTEYMNECLEIWEDQQMDQDMQKEARSSAYHEDEAVNLVRQYRQEKQKRYGQS